MVAVVIDDRAADRLLTAGASVADLLSESALIGGAAGLLVGEIRREVRSSFKNRSGRLEKSWSVRLLTHEGGQASAAAVSGAPYAMIHNHGGSILPKVRKLAIPFPGAGIPLGKWPRDFPRKDLFFFKSKRGNELLGMRVGGKLKPMFILKNRVILKATGYIDRAVDASAKPIVDLVDSELRDRLDKAIG